MKSRADLKLVFADGGAMPLGLRTRVMGVLNVTPDSFSDGDLYPDLPAALDAARRMVDDGADVIDVGGESTRPGAEPVEETEEANRVLPVIEGIKKALDVRVSVDTCKASVARRAIESGADMINDISALRDREMLPLLRETGTPVVLMHMRGEPRTMQRETRYEDISAEVVGFLQDCADTAAAAGLSNDKILIDPGIGFGKSVTGNMILLNELPALNRIGRPVLIGASRKSFIGKVLDLPVEDRLEGSLAVAAFAAALGAHMVRAHDVRATLRVVRMIDAIRSTERPSPTTK
jgi:dihydropteroate synthase